MAAPMENVFVCAETGLLKGISLKKFQCTNLNSLESADKEKEMCVMCWGKEDESEICIGLKNRQVLVYDVANKSFQSETRSFEGGSGKFRGLAKYDNMFLTAVESGLVKLWGDDAENCLEIDAGKDLFCMVQNQETPNIIATGGKENELKLWDLHKESEPIFKAKNVRNDWLNLRVPVWVMGIQFIPGSMKIVTSTGHHQVRMYDPSSPLRRPVMDVEVDEFPLTAIALRHDMDNQVLVGNTQGKMALLDLRNGKLMQVYKGFAGGIRDIKCHSSKPLVASCGLDRHLRIHNIDSKEMVHKFYLKSRLNCLLFSSKDEGCDTEESQEKVSAEEKVGAESGIESAGEDDIWENLEVVQTRTVKKKEKKETAEKVMPEKTMKKKRKKAEKLKNEPKPSKKSKAR